jgi:hypothetical protein
MSSGNFGNSNDRPAENLNPNLWRLQPGQSSRSAPLPHRTGMESSYSHPSRGQYPSDNSQRTRLHNPGHRSYPHGNGSLTDSHLRFIFSFIASVLGD